MKILGIHSLTHDSSVCLLEDGQIKFIIEEERLSKFKHHPGIEDEGLPPFLSLNWVLNESNLKIEDIDKFVHVGWQGNNYMNLDLIRSRFRDFAKSIDPHGTKTLFVPHHNAHAASAYFSSGFNDSIVLAIDGAGDWTSTSLYIGEGNKLTKIDEYPVDQSLGFMYSRAAKLLGLGDFGFGEGKLTALAGYGNPINEIPNLIHLDNGRYSISEDYYEVFKSFKRENGEFTQRHKDFAYVVQTELENAIIYILEAVYNKYRKKRICLSGGVALNCRLNGKINALSWVDDLFVQPGANDCGLSLGAAYLGAIIYNEHVDKMTSPFLGPEIPREEISLYIQRNKLQAEKLSDPPKTAAEMISQGKIVAWMQGRLEFGPRALGHRSLLGDPRSEEIKNKLNIIKQRENWRPIAPSIIDSDKRYCDLSKASEYMTIAIPMNILAVDEIPGGLHVDKTARVQVVKNSEDVFYKLIKHFENLTGVPAVLNTSLNAKGEPICTSIDDGIKFYFTTPTDFLIVEDWLIKK